MSPRTIPRLALLLPISLLALALPSSAGAQCEIVGHITASDESSDPELGAWEYTLSMQWDTGSNLALYYFEMFLDEVQRGCSCNQLQSGVAPGDTVGFSLESPTRCPVFYYAEFACQGDGNVPVSGQMLQFLQFDPQPCQAGSSGMGTFRFFSDEPPTDIISSDLYLVDEYEYFACAGTLGGVFPALPCDPLTGEKQTWGALKSVYGR